MSCPTAEDIKAQSVRVADVLVVGPFMIWAGNELGRTKGLPGWLLLAMGVGTIVYNGNNWLQIRQRRELCGPG